VTQYRLGIENIRCQNADFTPQQPYQNETRKINKLPLSFLARQAPVVQPTGFPSQLDAIPEKSFDDGSVLV